MARQIPEVVRAAAGLAAIVLDEARKLPETLPGLPVRLMGLAMQSAMKVQQQYAGFVARGDELFTGIRGENEPGLATFDDEEPAAAPSNGFRDSAFDRAGAGVSTVDETELATLPADPQADAVTSVVDGLADQIETGQQSMEQLAEEAPAIEEVLDEIAIDELVDQAPAPEETADVATTVDVLTPEGEVAPVEAAVTDEGVAAPEAPETGAEEAPAPGGRARKAAKATAAKATPAKATRPRKAADAAGGAATEQAETTDTAATDTAATDTNAGPATATDESGTDVAAATGVRTDVGASDTADEDAAIAQGAAVDAIGETSAAPTDDVGGGSELSGSQAAGTAPIEGYDGFSIAQLRGRLRGYALSTVQDLVSYEEATRARDPYLRMLRNRLEKLEEQAVESSPLAPRGT